jgi:hypothetical protein
MENSKQTEYYKFIDKIAWEDWDPIGLNKYEDARNEYYGYLPSILSKALNTNNYIELADFLFFIETERIGLDGNLNKCIDVAKKILDFKV